MWPEADETFFVNLSSPVNAAISDNQAVGTIVNYVPPTPATGIIAYTYSSDNGGSFQINLMNADGSGKRTLVATGTCREPGISARRDIQNL